MNGIETVVSNNSGVSRFSTSAAELHTRYRKWSFDLQTCEVVDECVLDSRAMHGWRPPRIASGRPQSAYLARKYKYNIFEVSLAVACFLCALIFSIVLFWLILRGLTPSGSLLVGCALVVVPYEAWILARRILRNPS
jgi:hypothetical protein